MPNRIHFFSDENSKEEFVSSANEIGVSVTFNARSPSLLERWERFVFKRSWTGAFPLPPSSWGEIIIATGGFAGLAKIIITFLNLKFQKRKITIISKNGERLEVEGNSVKEVESMLQSAKGIIVEEQENSLE